MGRCAWRHALASGAFLPHTMRAPCCATTRADDEQHCRAPQLRPHHDLAVENGVWRCNGPSLGQLYGGDIACFGVFNEGHDDYDEQEEQLQEVLMENMGVDIERLHR